MALGAPRTAGRMAATEENPESLDSSSRSAQNDPATEGEILREVALASAGYTISVRKKAVLSGFRDTYLMQCGRYKKTLAASDTSFERLASLWRQFRHLALCQDGEESAGWSTFLEAGEDIDPRVTAVRPNLPQSATQVVQLGAGAAPGHSAEQPNEPNKHHVLLVDDVDDVLVSVGAFLAKEGYAVQKAASGDEALRRVASDPRIEVLVTDFAMPGLNGCELIALAAQVRPNLKALMITAYPNADGLADLPSNTSVLVKPFRRSALIAGVESLLDSVSSEAVESREPERLQEGGSQNVR
jgi:CheY-like chemotaxis protein